MCAVVDDNANMAPYVVVVGDTVAPTQAFAIVDKKVLFEIKFQDIPFILF